ncbi:hypothetical protein [Bacillus sp. B15-48]|uniref:hypothetical protein n=1 Tax=Bacillus sp. B15-48 TaxID=1548601 RepID=UPI00193F16B7|nr:hypothetical protein [Bacillus sp. B15-48]
MPVDNFLDFYIPKDEDHAVTIIRVMYGGRDIDEQLMKKDEITNRSNGKIK